ncbi:Uncharacterised protein [Bordetella ansorpii]|uniref:Uncharacterized protein n=1 Tax=Bordetella ansorpii TaxID=288768 RepID=A0A157SW32_9BORD|nr:hypothetical protein [Bordetella ansorpii]SAI74649.1 Uncharacterised protein [Bordetella ansorpii]
MNLHHLLILAALVIGGIAVLAVCRRAWKMMGGVEEGEGGSRRSAGRWFYAVAGLCVAAWIVTVYLRFG